MRPTKLRDSENQRLADGEWRADTGPFCVFGRSWTVRTDDEPLRALVEDLFADVATPGHSHDHRDPAHTVFHVLAGDGHRRSLVARASQRIGGGSTPAATMAALVWGINRWVLDEASYDHLLLHAGGVVDAAGRAIILPAPSEAGKSTLTTALLDRGLRYLSDEAISITSSGIVTGYAKPISIDRGSWEVLAHHRPRPPIEQARYLERQWQVRASRISRTERQGKMATIIFPRFVRDREPSLDQVSPSGTLVRAGNCTFAPGNGTRIEASQLQDLAVALSGVPAYELLFSDLTAACDEILERSRP